MPITITSKFTPLTYDEITKPLLEATNAQQAVEDSYVETQDKAAKMMALANQQTDPVSYSKIKAMADDLQYQADQLSKYGLQKASRQTLINMKRRYASDIVPIEEAATRKKELGDEQRKLQVSNPNLIFQRDVNSMSLDDFVNNPSTDYGKSYDGTMIQKDVSDAMTAIAKGMADLRANGKIDKYTEKLIMQTGYTPQQVMEMYANGVKQDGIAGMVMQNALNKSGIYDWGDQSAITKAENFALQGLWSGVGETKMSTNEDYGTRLNAQSDAEIKIANAKNDAAEQIHLHFLPGQKKLDTKYYYVDEKGNYVDAYGNIFKEDGTLIAAKKEADTDGSGKSSSSTKKVDLTKHVQRYSEGGNTITEAEYNALVKGVDANKITTEVVTDLDALPVSLRKDVERLRNNGQEVTVYKKTCKNGITYQEEYNDRDAGTPGTPPIKTHTEGNDSTKVNIEAPNQQVKS